MKNLTQSHFKRNSKTSILFTICLAYLIFSGSSMMLISNFILGILKNIIGADIFLTAIGSGKVLPEQKLRSFLHNQTLGENAIVYDYTFGSRSMGGFMKHDINIGVDFKLYNGGTYPQNKIRLYPVEENYINATFADYYMPHSLQDGVTYPRINGKEDTIWSLYTDEATEKWEGGRNKYDIFSKNLNIIN